MSANVFDVVSIQKEKRLSSPRFELKRQQKTFDLHLCFSIWILVTGLSNEKNN